MKLSYGLVKILGTTVLLGAAVGVLTSGDSGLPMVKAQMTPPESLPTGTTPPPQAQDLFTLALRQFERGDYQGAIDSLNQGLQLSPNSSKAYELRGLARAQLGDINNAITDFSEAISRNPQEAQAYRNRGLTRLKRVGDEQQALADLQQAATLYQAQGQTEAYQKTLERIQALQAQLETPTGESQTTAQVSQLLETNKCRRCDLQGVDLRGANLLERWQPSQEEVLPRADLKETNLSKANLDGAFLRGADLQGANLSGASLSALLNQVNLSRADLSGADLSGARLVLANLENANLQGANLSGANLFRANLDDTNLDGANLKGAILPDGSIQN